MPAQLAGTAGRSREVAMLDDRSAHADAAEIVTWIKRFKRCNAPPKHTLITHGEPAAAEAMRQRIARELHWSCHMPY